MIHNPVSKDSNDQTKRKSWLESLQQKNIRIVIRVGERLYPDKEAEQHGIAYVSCEFDEATPSPGVVTAFLYTLRTSKAGGVAVHNDGSEGRAATLCSLHLMHTYGFNAAEAAIWLRIICPSMQMKKAQQDFLRAVGSELEVLCSEAAVCRERAFRRGVFQAWAAEELRPGWYGGRLESGYAMKDADNGREELWSTTPHSCGELLQTAKLHLDDCARLLQRTARGAAVLNLWPEVLICGAHERQEAARAAEASTLPEQIRMK